MTKTALIFSPIYYKHNTGKRHPESSQRLHAIIDELKRSNIMNEPNISIINPEKARIQDIQLIHATEYIKLVEAVCKSGGGLLDLQDTVVSPESYEVALYAAGGAVKAVNLVMNRRFDNAFALVRPPGHHAGKFRALGFCLFNNVAIAAAHLLEKFKLERILILDFDAHHGNGTQEAFYETDKVLYISLHEDPTSFPGTGFMNETGKNEGQGYTVNVPLPFQTTDKPYLSAINEIVTPIAQEYKPQFILVSAGFDTHYSDPVGNLSLSATAIQEIHQNTVRLASQLCHGRLVMTLEGGYNLKTIGKLASTTVATMSNTPYTFTNGNPNRSARRESQAAKIIDEVKNVQQASWKIAQ
jgi:acetoin utilization deacetylase AcuC-like enzyme